MADTLCADCGCTKRHEARGLCSPCYARHRRVGDLDLFPAHQTRWDPEDFVAEYQFIAATSTPAEACARIGVHPRTAIRLHKRAGHPIPPGLWYLTKTKKRNHDRS